MLKLLWLISIILFAGGIVGTLNMVLVGKPFDWMDLVSMIALAIGCAGCYTYGSILEYRSHTKKGL